MHVNDDPAQIRFHSAVSRVDDVIHSLTGGTDLILLPKGLWTRQNVTKSASQPAAGYAEVILTTRTGLYPTT